MIFALPWQPTTPGFFFKNGKAMHPFRRLATVMLSMGLAACGPGEPSVTSNMSSRPETAAPATPKVKIGLVMKTLTNPFFIEMEKGARRAAQELNINLMVKTAAQEVSIEQQIQLVDDLIAAKADAIVIAPGDSQRLIPALKKASDAGIKIVNIDNRLDPDGLKQAAMPPVPFISVDNMAGAYKAGKFLAEGVTTPTEAAIIEGIRSADNAQQRTKGARRALEENKFIKVVAYGTGNWEVNEAYQACKTMFMQHPNIKLLFAGNDMMAIGALKCIQDSGQTKVKVVGFDALAEAKTEIRAGKMLATVDQQAAEQGYQGVAIAVKLIQGINVPELNLINTQLINASSLK